MPTIGYRPSLETTQAVGALLLHQFARERFSQAGVDESLLIEAEHQEHVDELVVHSLLDDEYSGGDDLTATRCNGSNHHNELNSSVNHNISVQQADLQNVSNTATRNSTISHNHTSLTASYLNETSVRDEQEQSYHSIQEQSLNGTTTTNHDKTLYHSVSNASSHQDTTHHNLNSSNSTFERLVTSPNVSSYGEELRKIAEDFERSSLREIVRRRANQVNLSDITRESFTRLLKELFQEKVTREKIVVLFFFCTDVALRAAEFAQELVVKLMGWSFSFIINIFCSIVHKLGGWDKVLFYQLPSLLVTCCAGLAICALLVFLRNNLRAPSVADN